jgi:activator of 2-hydroxyglutaryl-CoA dehydratase
VKNRWALVVSIWALVAVCAVFAMVSAPNRAHAAMWFGAILAGSVAAVSLVHLVRVAKEGFVRELIYVGGGSYLILALASVYLFVKG